MGGVARSSSRIDHDDAACPPSGPFNESIARHYEIGLAYSELGDATMVSDSCDVRTEPIFGLTLYDATGTTTIQLDRGALEGTFVGQSLLQPGQLPSIPDRFVFQHRITITGGTGDLAGAGGSHVIWLLLSASGDVVLDTLELSGSVTVPAH
jgi:hypothetical protein